MGEENVGDSLWKNFLANTRNDRLLEIKNSRDRTDTIPLADLIAIIRVYGLS